VEPKESLPDVKFKAVVFGDGTKEYCCMDCTLPEALEQIKAKGIDPVKNFKMSIVVHY
jgi:hypothetical protein